MAGWVEQWGVVDEYEHGYRSEHVKITGLIEFPPKWVRQVHEDTWPAISKPVDWSAIWPRMAEQHHQRVHLMAARLGVPVIPHG
jgi:hypothetical protein